MATEMEWSTAYLHACMWRSVVQFVLHKFSHASTDNTTNFIQQGAWASYKCTNYSLICSVPPLFEDLQAVV